MLWHGRWKTFTRCDYQLPSSVYNLCAFQIQLGFHEKWNFQHSSEKSFFKSFFKKKKTEKKSFRYLYFMSPRMFAPMNWQVSQGFFCGPLIRTPPYFRIYARRKSPWNASKFATSYIGKTFPFFNSYALLYISPWLMPAFSWYFSSSTNPAIGKNVCSFTK